MSEQRPSNQHAPLPLSVSDADVLVYFWEEKGDLERFTGWEELQPALHLHHPEILKAWNDYKTAKRLLSAVLRGASVLAESNS
jgi:hypothetical protein